MMVWLLGLLARPIVGFALGNLKRDLGLLWTWLCHRSFWQLVSLGLAIFAIIQHFQIIDARHDRDSYKGQRDTIQGRLDKITSAKDHQKVVTRENIKVVTKQLRHADDVAKKIEQAPLPGNCKSPPEVMGADL